MDEFREEAPWTIRDAQSTEKSVFNGFLSLVSVYGQTNSYGRIYGFFSCKLGSATTTLPRHHSPFDAISSLAVSRTRRVNISATTPSPRPHCTFETRGILRAPSDIFSATIPRSRSPPGPVGFRNLRIFQNSDWATMDVRE